MPLQDKMFYIIAIVAAAAFTLLFATILFAGVRYIEQDAPPSLDTQYQNSEVTPCKKNKSAM